MYKAIYLVCKYFQTSKLQEDCNKGYHVLCCEQRICFIIICFARAPLKQTEYFQLLFCGLIMALYVQWNTDAFTLKRWRIVRPLSTYRSVTHFGSPCKHHYSPRSLRYSQCSTFYWKWWRIPGWSFRPESVRFSKYNVRARCATEMEIHWLPYFQALLNNIQAKCLLHDELVRGRLPQHDLHQVNTFGSHDCQKPFSKSRATRGEGTIRNYGGFQNER